MDIIVTDHSSENLEVLFNASFALNHPLFSVLTKNTDIPWLVFIPKQEMNDKNEEYIGKVYAEIHRIAAYLKRNGINGHTNVAKIGNKHPNYHIHLVFRSEQDEAWPDAIWCHEPLKESDENTKAIKQALKSYS